MNRFHFLNVQILSYQGKDDKCAETTYEVMIADNFDGRPNEINVTLEAGPGDGEMKP